MKFLIAALLAAIPLLCSSCTSGRIKASLDTGYFERSSEINALMVQLDDGAAAKPIRWKDGLSRMYRDNLAYKQSARMLEEAERERSRAWRQLIPRVSGYANLTSGLDDVLDFSSDDINRTLSFNFTIPNPFNFYATLYGAGLRYEDAKYSHDLDGRRAYVSLYKAYLTAYDLREDVAELQRDMQRASITTSDKGAEDVYRIQQRWLSLKRRRNSHRVNVNKLFDTPGDNWDLVGKLPDISFRKEYRNVKIGSEFGKTAMYLYAIRMESAILRNQQIKMRQWPLLNFGITQPPLYSSTNTTSYEFENFRLFSSASKSIELVDPLGREEVQDAEKRFAYTRRMVRQSLERDALSLNELRDAYHQVLLTEQRLLKAREILEREAPEDAEVVLVQLDALNDNQRSLSEVRRKIIRLELQYLIWNETFWH